MAAAEVKGDYEQLEQVAQRFGQQSEAISQMIQTLKSAMDPLKSDWLGDAQVAFFDEMDGEVMPATVRLQEALQTASEVTNTIAETLKQAEEEGSNIFKAWRA